MKDSAKSAIALHQFANVLIFQTTEDIYLKDGSMIPTGYVNATHMCKACNKEFKKWFGLKTTTAYLEALEEGEVENIPPVIIYIIRVDGTNYDYQGIWVHYDVALTLAQWLNPKFAVWASRTLKHVLMGNFQALTPEAEKAQKELQKVWLELRSVTIETFWFLTDSIKAYYTDHPREEKYNDQNYSEVFNALNIGLFGKTSKIIKEELGLTKSALNRDHFGREALKRIEMIQRLAEAQIAVGHTPLKSVEIALAMFHYPIRDFKD